jgi:phage terminase small subunit
MEETTDTLTPKQRRFVEEYIIDLNGAQAAIRAGYAPNSASSIIADLHRPERSMKPVVLRVAASASNRTRRSLLGLCSSRA